MNSGCCGSFGLCVTIPSITFLLVFLTLKTNLFPVGNEIQLSEYCLDFYANHSPPPEGRHTEVCSHPVSSISNTCEQMDLFGGGSPHHHSWDALDLHLCSATLLSSPGAILLLASLCSSSFYQGADVVDVGALVNR